MERMFNVMLTMAPVGVAIMACVAFGFALAAREALGMERGMRAAAEKARAAAVKTLAANKDWELAELNRFRRLLDCHLDAMIAEATDFRGRPVPSPGGILESLCGWNADWKRDLIRSAGLQPDEVEQLLKNDLPITPLLARHLEVFTGAPARYWEYVHRLHTEYRAETDQTVVIRLGEAVQVCQNAGRAPASAAGSTSAAVVPAQHEEAAPPTRRRPVLELVDDGSPVLEPAPVPWSESSTAAELPATVPSSSPAPRSAATRPHAAPPLRRAAAAVPAPVVPAPGLVAREPRGALPPPPTPRHRSPVASRTGSAPSPTGRAATLTDFPIQREGAPPAGAADWAEVERPPLNTTILGIGSNRTSG